MNNKTKHNKLFVATDNTCMQFNTVVIYITNKQSIDTAL